jgi:hypothetical protein
MRVDDRPAHDDQPVRIDRLAWRRQMTDVGDDMPSLIPTSAVRIGRPEPSTTRPPLMIVSNGMLAPSD